MKKESSLNYHRSAEQKCWQFLVLFIGLSMTTNALPTTTPQPPPVPFKFSYEAGRAPGGRPDRYVEQEGDGTGQVRGSYTYLDPNWTWQTVSNVFSRFLSSVRFGLGSANSLFYIRPNVQKLSLKIIIRVE